MTPPAPRGPIELAPAAEAPAGSSDVTRRWALRFPDGRERFAGIARTEAEAAIGALAGVRPGDWDRALVEIALPVLLTEGAGPYLLDAAGRVTLVLGPHGGGQGARVAMGEPRPRHRIGLVRRLGPGPLWTWLVDAELAPAERISALDALDAAAGPEALQRWQRRARGVGWAASEGGGA